MEFKLIVLLTLICSSAAVEAASYPCENNPNHNLVSGNSYANLNLKMNNDGSASSTRKLKSPNMINC